MSNDSFLPDYKHNSFDSPDLQTTQRNNKVRIPKKTLILLSIAYFLLCGAIVVTGEMTHSIQGPWVRGTDDSHLAGMVVNVEKNGAGQLEGIVIQMGEMIDRKFKVGQVKWTSIKRIGAGKFSGYQLTHGTDDYGNDEWYYGQRPSIFYVGFGNRDLYLEDSNNDLATGKFQHWTKQN